MEGIALTGQVTYFRGPGRLTAVGKAAPDRQLMQGRWLPITGQRGPGMGPWDPGMMQWPKPRAPKIKSQCIRIHPSTWAAVGWPHPAASWSMPCTLALCTACSNAEPRPLPGWPSLQLLRNLRTPSELVADYLSAEDPDDSTSCFRNYCLACRVWPEHRLWGSN